MHPNTLRTATVLFLCSFVSGTIGAPSLREIFEVSSGNVKGSCDNYFPQLENMFTEMQTINTNTIEELKTDNYNSNAETRKLVKAMFGISPSANDEEPEDGLGLDKLNKVREWFRDMQEEIEVPDPPETKPQLYCDSNFIEYLRPEDKAPDDAMKTVERRLTKAHTDANHEFWIPNQGTGSWMHLPKSRYPMFGTHSYDANNPTYCAQPGWFAWTIEKDFHQRTQPIVILCPSSFNKQNIYNEDIPDLLDTSQQPEGTVLDRIEPRYLTLYHELFHVIFDPENRIERSPDSRYFRAKRYRGQPIRAWPALKSAFQDGGHPSYGAIECMYVSFYDLAFPPETILNEVRSTKNPESYAWFAVANYLSSVGPAHQDWSSGACRQQGAAEQAVTVTRGGTIPKRTISPSVARTWF